ncbi:unnamed protein product [Wuchereria bancrofti]|uniref:Uncharacterized protein n=1 Tax=Wuchereria bancrofti TaxID=6293 RepID=A0A3P7G055_WUCBA|nr:unnamed protein product [Wuchereria bancrofti]
MVVLLEYFPEYATSMNCDHKLITLSAMLASCYPLYWI